MADFYRGPHGRGRTRRGSREAALGPFSELKNHVRGIATAVQLALSDEGTLPEHHRNYLRQIDGECRKLVRLAQELQKLSSLTTEGDVFAVVCIYCDETVLIAPHVGETEAAAMAEHLRKAHPDRI